MNPNTCWEPPSLAPSFSDHQIAQVTDVQNLGVPLDTTFTTSAHCKEAANTAWRLLPHSSIMQPGLKVISLIGLCMADRSVNRKWVISWIDYLAKFSVTHVKRYNMAYECRVIG